MTIHSIFTYPVKSCGAVTHDQIAVESRGLRYDRRWVIIDRHQENRFLSQRSHSVMARIKTRLDGQGMLYLNAPGHKEFAVPQPHTNTLQVKMWKDESPAYDLGDEAAAWLAAVFQDPSVDLRLCYQGDRHFRPSDPDFSASTDSVSFADSMPVLITNRASLDGLNSHLPEAVTMDRFRANIVIEGFDAYAEDLFAQIKIGDVIFDVTKGCGRCKIITLDPQTGEAGNPDSNPLKILAEQRRGYKGKAYFGVTAIPRSVGTIKAGDTVEVLKRHETPIHLQRMTDA